MDDATVMRSPRPSPKNTKKLNPAANTFNPTSIGFEAPKEGLNTTHTGTGVKESTTQWVHRAFEVRNVVATQSFQEIAA